MEQRYQRRWNEAMMGDYVWNLMRKCNTTYKRKIIQTSIIDENVLWLICNVLDSAFLNCLYVIFF